MKKIFTLMLAFACALFVGVSCTNEGTDDGGTTNPYDVTITVSELAEALPADGGEATLTYTLSKEYAGESVVLGEPTANWLTPTLLDEGNAILVNATANTNYPGSEPREASFTVSYKNAKDVTVVVKQLSAAPSYKLNYTNTTPQGTYVTVDVLDTTLADKQWGILYATESSMIDWETMQPKEPMAWLQTQLDEAIGYYGGVSSVFVDNPYMPQGNKMVAEPGYNTPFYCTIGQTNMWGGATPGTPGDKLYIFVVGLELDQAFINYEKETDATRMLTAVHLFQAPLPVPAITASLDEALSNEAGSVEIDVKVDQTFEGANFKASLDDWACKWLTVSYADGKVKFNYQENPYAVNRSTVVTINYGMEDEFGDLTPYAKPLQLTVVQSKNPNAASVTFTFEVVETHFDHILVNVTPSDLNATYVLGNIQQMGFDDAYKGDWVDLVASQASNEPLTGAKTNYRLAIEDYDSSDDDDPESWKYWVYAFAVDAENGVAAGEASKTLVAVTNDMPKILCPEGMVEKNGYYVLDVYGKGGTYTFNLNVQNPVDGGAFYGNAYGAKTEWQVAELELGYPSEVFGNERTINIDNSAKTVTFTVNDYPEGGDPNTQLWAEFGIKYADSDGGALGKPQTFRVYLHPAE